MSDRKAATMTTEESSRAIKQEERTSRMRIAALRDTKFMTGVREALAEEANGGRGTPWQEVKKALGIN